MARKEPPRAAELAALLAFACPDAAPYRVALAVQALQVSAKAHKRAAENECSYPLTDTQIARADRRCAKLAAAAVSTLKNLGAAKAAITAEFGGDPRGCCGTLHIEGARGDGMGGGYPIY